MKGNERVMDLGERKVGGGTWSRGMENCGQDAKYERRIKKKSDTNTQL